MSVYVVNCYFVSCHLQSHSTTKYLIAAVMAHFVLILKSRKYQIFYQNESSGLVAIHNTHPALLHYREKESAYLSPNLSGATSGNLAGSSSLDRQITSSLSLISVVVMFDAVLWNCESVTIFLNFLLVILTIHCEHFCVKKWPFKIFSKVAKYNFWHFLPLLPVI